MKPLGTAPHVFSQWPTLRARGIHVSILPEAVTAAVFKENHFSDGLKGRARPEEEIRGSVLVSSTEARGKPKGRASAKTRQSLKKL